MNDSTSIITATGGEHTADLKEVILPPFYLDFLRLPDYNGEFGFDKYDKSTHTDGTIISTATLYSKNVKDLYPLYSEIDTKYRSPWICIWPPRSEYENKIAVNKTNEAKLNASIVCQNNDYDYDVEIEAVLPAGIAVNGKQSSYTFNLQYNKKTKKKTDHELTVSCVQTLQEDVGIEFYYEGNKSSPRKLVGVLKVFSNKSENIFTPVVKIHQVFLTEEKNQAVTRLNPAKCLTTPAALDSYFNNRAFNQALVHVQVDPDIDEIELPKKDIDNMLSTVNIEKTQAKVDSSIGGNKEFLDLLSSATGDVTVLFSWKNNSLKFIDKLSPKKKLEAAKKELEEKRKKLEEDKKKIEKKLAKQEQEAAKLKREKEEHILKFDNKISKETNPIKKIKTDQEKEAEMKNYDFKISKKDKEKQETETKLAETNHSLEKNQALINENNEKSKHLGTAHNLYICNDIYGQFSDGDTQGLTAGFALTHKYDACLFGAADKSRKAELFAHEVGHLFSLREFFEDLDKASKGSSKENFMDYKIVRKSFQYWQWLIFREGLSYKRRK